MACAPAYLSDVGIVNALGASKAEVLRGLLAADHSGMAPFAGLLTRRSTVVGEVRAPLAPLPPSLAKFECRNNRLLKAALDQLAASVTRTADSDVVDSQLRVRGVDNLRVMDASVLPVMVAGNLNGQIMAMAWRAADMILDG